MLNFEILSLAVINESGQNMERFTVNSERAVLLEKGVALDDKTSFIGRVCESQQLLIKSDLDEYQTGAEDSIFGRLNCRSVLGLPLRTESRTWGVLLLGHSQPGAFDSVSQMTLRTVQYYLSFNLALRAAVGQGRSNEKLLTLLERLSDHEHDLPVLQQKLEIITETLSRSLPVTSCRVSILGSDRDRLNTISEYNLRTTKNGWAKFSPLADLPWHRMVMDSKKTMLVNQDDPESTMPTSEVNAAFHRPVNSALLVPLVVGKDSIGMLTLAEERTWARRPFSHSEIQTAHLVADRLADCFYRHLLEKKIKAKSESMPATRAVLSTRVRESLSDPLCGILGASELILAQSDEIDPRTAYYVQVIHKMAERIRDRVSV
ncbi:MAG: GAF domain-containing protein, partial [candidate division Zixibacteria bacterium]|nr:GAF domain-containing protein [candidate division Zixibacteria bacterium]